MIKYIVLGALLSLNFSSKAVAQADFNAQRNAYENLKNDLNEQWISHKTIQEKGWDKYKEQIRQKWSDGIMPSVKSYVEYWDNDQARLRVDYEKGVIYLEAVSEQKLSKLKIADNFQNGLSKHWDLVEDQVQFKDGISFNKDSLSELTNHLTPLVQESGNIKGTDGKDRNLYRIELPMVPDHIKRRASKYLPSVLYWANKNSIPPALILAIMWQESAFNPLARSYIPAFGLMQIVPKFAGEDVKSVLKESEVVDGNFLYNSENNLRYGTSYLKILSDRSFSKIEPFEKRAPFIIAGYNWGPNRLLAHIKKGSIKITSPKDIKDQIHRIAPKETKDYLIKVIDHWKQIDREKWI
jgi:membrane-bound lytic murein transglycosylase C